MRESASVGEALRTFFAKNASGDATTFEEVVSTDEAALAIGSWAKEWYEGQEAVRSAYGLEGVLIDPGEILAWENGETGWAIAEAALLDPGRCFLPPPLHGRVRAGAGLVEADPHARFVSRPGRGGDRAPGVVGVIREPPQPRAPLLSAGRRIRTSEG